MENSSSVRRRTSRNTRELTPDPKRFERNSKVVEKDSPAAESAEPKYVVTGILNVGPPSPAGSSVSSVSSSSGSHSYRAKILRYPSVLIT